jgi:ABC-type amino acid transport substrate-binding protein/heat shock protein HslJ
MQHQKHLILIVLLALILGSCAQPTPAPTLRPPISTPVLATPIPTRGAPAPSAQDNSWQEVQQAGVLRVATSGDYPPFEYYDDKFELDGFDVALIRQIGQQLGLKVEVNDYAFNDLPTVVGLDQADVAISALSVTPERQAVADFSNVYFASTDAVLSRPEADAKNINNPTALAAAKLGVQVNSIYAAYAQDKLIDTGKMPKQNLYVYPDISQAVADLKGKRIDAVWLDLKPAQSFVNEGGVKIVAQDVNQQLYAIGLKKGSDTLRDKLNTALTQLQNDGTLAKLQEQYLGIKSADIVPVPVLPTPAPVTPEPVRCDGAEWLADLSYDDKDGTAPPVLNPGQPFTKGWRMSNSGTCSWTTQYVMAYSYGNVPAAQMGGQPIPVTREVKPNETFDFQVNLIAPTAPGTYQGFWLMRDAQNREFGKKVWVYIIVPGPATPTPVPPQTPSPNISFEAKPSTITAGQSVLFKWETENVKAVYFYHDGQNWSDHGVSGDGQATEYPPNTVNYYLRVINRDDSATVKTRTITVNPAVNAPVIDYFNATPSQVMVGQNVSVDWSVSGQVSRVDLVINNVTVWPSAPASGNYQDYADAAGTRVYTLQAGGPGGKAPPQQVAVNVQNGPPEPPQNPLANTNWKLQSGEGLGIGPIDTKMDVLVTAFFGADGSLNGNGGCNPYNTSYEVGGQAITIYPPAAAAAAVCGDPADTIEQTYLGLLPQAANYELSGGQLIIRGNQGQELLRYTPM